MATSLPQLDPEAIRNAYALQRLPAPQMASLSMPSVSPALPPSTLPSVSQAPPTSKEITGSRLLGDQTELKRLGDEGSGISQIQNPVLHGLAKTGNIIESILAPRAAAVTPGTEENHQRLLNQQTGRVNNDFANEQSQANTTLLDAQPQLKMLGLENAQLRNQAYSQHVADQGEHYDNQDTNHLRDTGYTLDETDPSGQKLRPLRYDEMSEKQQAAQDLVHAHTEEAEATAAMKKAQNDPSSPAFKLAKQRVDVARLNAQTAVGKLNLYGQSLDLRRQNTNASLYGTDNSGNALPGAAQITGDNGEQTTVGSKFAPTAIKANTKTVTFNDLTGSVSHLRNAIKAYESEGGDMSDPRLAAAASDPNSTVGKVIQGKLVTGGLSPSAITLLNAQRQTEEQAGILRSTTGGTSSEAGAQRILAVVPHFGSDTNQSAYSKLDEQEGVLKRLSPGQTHVHGGVSVSKPGGSAPASYAQTATGPNGHKIGSNDGGKTWVDVKTGKALQ